MKFYQAHIADKFTGSLWPEQATAVEELRKAGFDTERLVDSNNGTLFDADQNIGVGVIII